MAAIAACDSYVHQAGESLAEGDCYFSFLPLAHVFDRCASAPARKRRHPSAARQRTPRMRRTDPAKEAGRISTHSLRLTLRRRQTHCTRRRLVEEFMLANGGCIAYWQGEIPKVRVQIPCRLACSYRQPHSPAAPPRPLLWPQLRPRRRAREVSHSPPKSTSHATATPERTPRRPTSRRQVLADIGACKPTLFCGVPRVFDRIYAGIQDQLAANFFKRILFGFFLARKKAFMQLGYKYDKVSFLDGVSIACAFDGCARLGIG